MIEFLIPSAYADTGAVGAQQAGLGSLLVPLVLMVVIFYFMLWRPQSKRMKEHKALIQNLSKGDEVVSSGGLLGKVVAIEEDILTLEVASNTQVKLQKAAVTAVLPKGTIKFE
jgi:preprotein translocase subunit YajC